MTASNFAHLEPDFPTVHAAATSAVRLAMSEPEAAAILAGKAVELALGWAFAHDAGLDEGEALSFLFEHFDSVTDEETLTHRLRLFNSELEARKR